MEFLPSAQQVFSCLHGAKQLQWGKQKAPAVLCSANQQGRHISENKSIAQVSALNQAGKRVKPKGSHILSLMVRVVIAFLPLKDSQTILKQLLAI